MNRLGYSAKFGVMILLIAVPLGYLATQQFNTAREQLEEAHVQKRGLALLTQSHRLIGALENWRDAAVLRFLSSNAEIERLYYQMTTAANEEIESLRQVMLSQQALSDSSLYLTELKSILNRPIISPGMEGISFELIFDNVQRVVSEAYVWQRRVASENALLGLRDTQTYATVNLVLYDSSPVFESVGLARAAGTFYLFNKLLDSNSIYMIDKAYTRLDKELERIETRQAALSHDSREAELAFGLYTHGFHQIMDMLDGDLIQVTELQRPWREYFDQTSLKKRDARDFEHELLKAAQDKVQQIETDRQQWLNHFLFFSAGVLLLIVLLYIGFYYSVKLTITQLIKSAEAVASGNLDQEMHTRTKDELFHLGQALDHMRTQLKARQMKLRHLSITDGLTGLKNRKFFDEVMSAEVNRAARDNYPISLLMMDIDHFKSINDRYGHVAGDTCLQYVAGKLRHHLKRANDVAARYGGEEFVAILPNMLPEHCLALAEQFREDIERSVIVAEHHTITCTLSCGIASMVPGSKEDVTPLIQAADSALYAAKHAGRNRCMLGQPLRTRHKDLAAPQSVDRHSCQDSPLNEPAHHDPDEARERHVS